MFDNGLFLDVTLNRYFLSEKKFTQKISTEEMSKDAAT